VKSEFHYQDLCGCLFLEHLRYAFFIYSFQEFGIFWPVAHEEMEAENFRVKFVEEGDRGGHVTRDFTLQSVQDDYELAVHMIHCANWPHSCSPIISMLELINLVQEWHLEYQNGPIIVMDRYGLIIQFKY
jgi:receptor-type tyrosine-protein phosphatase gamma